MSQVLPFQPLIDQTDSNKNDNKWITVRHTSMQLQPNPKPFRFPRFSSKLSVNRENAGTELPLPLKTVLQINDTLLFKEVIVLKNESCYNETQIGYYICDQKGDRLFYVVQETANLFAAFNALITVDNENYAIKINGKSVWASLIFNECLRIESPPGNQIGRVLIKFAYKSEYHVFDENDAKSPLFVIKPKEANFFKSNSDHFLYENNNQNESDHEMGLITQNIELLTHHQLKRGMHFGINFPHTLNIKSKTLLMCTALLIHIHRFQPNYC